MFIKWDIDQTDN